MIKLYKSVVAIVFGFVVLGNAQAQVVINEFCVANYNDYSVGGEYEDWVEFYNPSASAISLTGFWLSDDITQPLKYQIPAGVTVPANGYKIILLSGQGDFNPTYLGQTNTNFKVNQSTGDAIVFSDAGGNVLETYDFALITPNQMNQSYGRVPNGSGSMLIQTNPSPLAANSGTTATGYAARPQLSLEAGYYASAISVTITTTEPGATIYYTTNGSLPTNASTVYSGPINISTTTVLRAIVYSSNVNILPSFVETNTYFFGADNHTVPVVNISGASLSDGQWSGSELTTIEFFAPGGAFLVEGHGDSNEHGNDSNAYGQRGFDYIDRDEMGYDHEVVYPLFQHTNRQQYQRLIFKAAANDNYPFSNGGAHIRDAYVSELSILGNLHLDERKTESCIVYINGSYWGVYEIREKVDDSDYTDYYYNQKNGNVDFLKTWGGTWAEYSAAPGFNPQTQWNTLRNFITSNSMAVQANYDYVLTQYNTKSLIDYFILNEYAVCTDWLNWNTAWWKGTNPNGGATRWRYALWDEDATFGHYINYTGVPSTQPTADPCQTDNMGDVGGQGHIPVLNALFDSPDFFADYIQRYAELSNTIFSCQRMTEVLDSMIAVIQPEMTRHCQRWGGNTATWDANVQTLRNFILARCNTEIIGGIADCYQVVPYNVTFQASGTGSIIVGETPLGPNDFPWNGTYFADLPIDIEAVVTSSTGPCTNFLGWEIVSGTGVIADPSSPVTTLTISSDVVLQANFGLPASGPVTVMSDVAPAGAGTIAVNGTAQTTYPQDFVVNAGDSTSYEVLTTNPWYTFSHWETNHATINPNDAATLMYINPCVADTIYAVYDFTPHAVLTVDVFPAGAGTVTMDATLIASYPWSNDIQADLDYHFVANPIVGVTLFDHWEINHHTLNPDNLTPDVILHFMETDSLIAVFTIIDQFPLTVDVQPAGAGTVTMNGTPWTPLPSTQVISENTLLNFVASPSSTWSNFLYWQINHHVISPSLGAAQMNFTFTQEDTLVAVFTVTPHHEITVKVDPAGAGTVDFDGGLTTMNILSVELEDFVPVNFSETAEPNWYFIGWESVAGHAINPDVQSEDVSITFTQTDTVIAHFDKEPYLYYIPNCFTPNDDNLNEVFAPVLNAVDPADYWFTIYDRWGVQVFKSTKLGEGWNGSMDNSGKTYVKDDAYIWRLHIKPQGGKEVKEFSGTVVVFR